MATVPHSVKTTDAIKEQAVKTFTASMAKAINTIREDPELHMALITALSTPEQAALAYKLAAFNPFWVQSAGSTIHIAHEGTNFQIETQTRPSPLANYRGQQFNTAEMQQAPSYTTALVRFLKLHAPFARAEADKKAIEAAIDAVIGATPNLQRAVEVMPSIYNWLPAEVRARYDAPQPKRAGVRTSAETIKANALTPEALAAMARGRMLEP